MNPLIQAILDAHGLFGTAFSIGSTVTGLAWIGVIAILAYGAYTARR
jgi:hypothetical protein